MRKLILIFITIFTVTTASAQGLDLGIKAGVNFASITDASEYSNRTGFVVGVFAGVKFGDKLGIQGDLLYSQQGAEFDGELIDLNYVNVPVVLKYYVTENFNIQAGPQFGFIVDDNFKELPGTIGTAAEAEAFDLTGVAGVAYDFVFGIRVSGRYNFGLTDIVNSESGKNSVITLAVGYSFL